MIKIFDAKKNGRGISSAHAISQVIKNFEKYTNQQIPLILRKPMESGIISGCEFSRLLSEKTAQLLLSIAQKIAPIA